MDGLLKCSRYAFGPNRLHYCGPDASAEVKAYIDNGVQDFGLAKLLTGFRTMYPYLQLIAGANGIADPFDVRVVEAYWLGNDLLTGITKQQLYIHLLDTLQLKKRLGVKHFEYVKTAIGNGAMPHHNFHVFDIWKRNGNSEREHTLDSLDSCRISWGKVIKAEGPALEIQNNPLTISHGQIKIDETQTKKIFRHLESSYDIEQLKPGQIVSIHWGVPCEIITKNQAKVLDKLTLKHLAIANQSL